MIFEPFNESYIVYSFLANIRVNYIIIILNCEQSIVVNTGIIYKNIYYLHSIES